MRYFIFLILSISVLFSSCSRKESLENLEITESENGLYDIYLYQETPFSGLAVDTSYSNGDTIIENYNIKNGRLNGSSSATFQNEQLKYEKNFQNGLRHGMFKEYYSNGQLKEKRIYENDTIVDGVYEVYYKNGALKQKRKYEKGLRVDFQVYDKEGNLSWRNKYNFKNGIKHGRFYEFRRDKNSSGDIEKKIFEGKYSEGEYSNYSKKEFIDGNIVRTTSFDGKIIVDKSFHENGQLFTKTIYDTESKVRLEAENRDSLGNFRWREYLREDGVFVRHDYDYRNGGEKLALTYKKDGQKIGEEYYYKIGELKSRKTYINETVYYEEFYKNGRLKKTGIVNNNWIYYDDKLNLDIPKLW